MFMKIMIAAVTILLGSTATVLAQGASPPAGFDERLYPPTYHPSTDWYDWGLVNPSTRHGYPRHF